MREPKAVIRQCCAMVADDALISKCFCRYDVGQCVVSGLLGVCTKSGIGVVECQPPGMNMQGRIQVGGGGVLGGQDPASPFWGGPKLHKEGKTSQILRILVLNSYPDPPSFPKSCILPELVCGYNGVYTFTIWI